MNILFISLAPVFIILFYVYSRDKYEREPWKMLLKALLIGGLVSVPTVFIEMFLSSFAPEPKISNAAYTAFVVAGFTEESLKYLAFILIIWNSKHFNEKFDGIVYAVFISLGFAGIENIIYVSEGNSTVGIFRALTAVPAHALFGVTMGYYFGLARFFPDHRKLYLMYAYLIPIALHGFYNFCLMSEHYLFLILFIPFVAYLWITGFRKMKYLSDRSIYRDNIEQ